jgi:hypothetical protein
MLNKMTPKERSQLKALWFARWISMCYADTFVGKDRMDDGSLKWLPYENGGMTVLNMEDGHWYAKQLVHFEETVFPNWLKLSYEKENLAITLNTLRAAKAEAKLKKEKAKEAKWYAKKEKQKEADRELLKNMKIL